MNNKKPRRILGGVGFYTVLLICLAAVGAVSWFWLFQSKGNAKKTAAPTEQETKTAAGTSAGTRQAAAQTAIPDDSSVQPRKPAVPKKTESSGGSSGSAAASEPGLIVSPVNGSVVEAFSMDHLAYDETLGDWRTHDGVDIASTRGTGVQAACAGTVKSVQDDPMMGTSVTISHTGGYETVYANLEAKPTVKEGDTVSAGQIIGAVGATSIAESAEGPHLHFSVTKNGTAIDPNTFLQK